MSGDAEKCRWLQGTVQLLYFKGDDSAGDLFYVRRGPDDAEFSAPLRVNSASGSAIATGTIRGAQQALGADNSIQVAWNGSQAAKPNGPNGELPLLYTRLVAGASGFEPQRNIIREAYRLDGGACITSAKRSIVWRAVR